MIAAAMAVWALAAANSLTSADVTVGDVAIRWHTGRGMAIYYRGTEAFAGYASEFTLHDPPWKKTYYSSRHGTARATLGRAAGRAVLEISDDAENFKFTKIVVIRRSSLEIRYRYCNKKPRDGRLQLGMLPRPDWLNGADYTAWTAEGEKTGNFGTRYSDRRILFSGIRRLQIRSPFGIITISSTHPMTLYDHRDKGTFWLGWDEALTPGKTYTATVRISFAPGAISAQGVDLSDLSWTRSPTDGILLLSGRAASKQYAGRAAAISAEATRAGKLVARISHKLSLSARPTPFQLRIPAIEAGRYKLKIVISISGLQNPIALPELSAEVPVLISAAPAIYPYTDEQTGEILVWVSDDVPAEGLTLSCSGPGISASSRAKPGMSTVSFPLAGVPNGLHEVMVSLKSGARSIQRTRCRLLKAPPAPNAVKIDHRTRALIVQGKPFFPFGFYTHRGRFYDTNFASILPDLEAPFGFNLICVYHNFGWTDRLNFRPRIKKFLQRAYDTGFMMHYDIRAMTCAQPTDGNLKRIGDEIKAFRDHPGVLCWYLADEPAGQRIPPDRFLKQYPLLKQWDPYHPTTMVFCIPSRAREYVQALDIVMLDPYPIPNTTVELVARWLDMVREQIGPFVPIWCVPQAFGGGEWWGREPTPREERCMTYLAIVHGATGVQYFIRRPPWNNPFVHATWGEIRKMAREIRELAPLLLSPRPKPQVKILEPADHIHAAAWADEDYCLVIAVNTSPNPTRLKLSCSQRPHADQAQVLFEQRTVPISKSGQLEDVIDAFGVRCYLYPIRQPPPADIPGNLLRNGSFEQQTNVGFPDYFHVGQGNDLAASWGTDPLEAHHGRHSLYIRTPSDGGGPTVISFPVRAAPGRFRLSAWMKCSSPGHVKLGISGFRVRLPQKPEKIFDVGTSWQRIEMEFQTPSNVRAFDVRIQPLTKGVLWVDELIVSPAGQ